MITYTTDGSMSAVYALGVVFVVVGFAFKVSAVPFHTWAPDTYEGAPTPVTAFLSVASKAAGFVALLTVVYVAFPGSHEVWQPVFWILTALTMTVGNAMALRQSNVVRMLAYSSIAQGGFMLVPFAVANSSAQQSSFEAVVVYTPTPTPTAPCGACRQVLAEFGQDTLVILADESGKIHRQVTVQDLLPGAFTPQDLLGE